MMSKYLHAISASFGLFSLGAAVASSSVGQVAVTGETRTARVSYADLDLSRPAGLASLNRRIRWAASALCTSRGTKSLMEPRADRECVRTALADTAEEIDAVVEKFQAERGDGIITVQVHR
jgi:UrcA family protein